VTGRDSVPVAISIVVTICVVAAISIAVAVSIAVYVAAHDDGGILFVEASSVESATTSTMEATALEICALSRTRDCARCGEGG
jgi:hypothetical protein